MDLLIDLIEKRKLLINDISLTAVTDDYMKYVAEMEEHNLRETTQFVLMASTLLLIKSKSLLPVLDLSQEEEESVENLESRLKLYQIFRSAGKDIETIFGKQMQHERQFVPSQDPLFMPDKFSTQEGIMAGIQSVLQNLPKKEVKKIAKVRTVVSLEEMIDRLRLRVERQLSFWFKDFTQNATERTTVIVGFLAVLEMVKQGNIDVTQPVRYTDIEIIPDQRGLPRYA